MNLTNFQVYPQNEPKIVALLLSFLGHPINGPIHSVLAENLVQIKVHFLYGTARNEMAQAKREYTTFLGELLLLFREFPSNVFRPKNFP